MVALWLVALALGLSNFAAAIGIGISGVDTRTRLWVGVTFGLFEAGMPLLGLALGRALTGSLGPAAHWIGVALLIAIGGYSLWQALRGGRGAPQSEQPARPQPRGKLLMTGLAMSLDNLAVGFALGTYRVSLLMAVLVIGAVSVTLSLIGLELGARIGAKAGHRGELLGGVVLIAVGIALALQAI